MQNLTLNNLELNKIGYIENISCSPSIKRRLLDLGLISKTAITPLFRSISGDPSAYLFRGSVIALRNQDACKIEITTKV